LRLQPACKPKMAKVENKALSDIEAVGFHVTKPEFLVEE
jgi:hypothetical protein